MPSIFSHGVAAFALKKLVLLNNESGKVMLLGIVCSMIPDADTLGFAFGIPYSSLWGHRGFTHSFAFAFLLALLIVGLFFRKVHLFKESGTCFWATSFLQPPRILSLML